MAGELGFDTGPYVNAACFCEQAIQEKDDVLTLVRIVDQMTLSVSDPAAPDDLPAGGAISTTLVIALKAGQAKGRSGVQVTMEHPDGSRHPGPKLPVHFTGGENNGANLVLKMAIELTSVGIYWADVSVNDRLVTRVPLEIRYQKLPPGTQPLA